MATEICNVLAVHLGVLADNTAVGNRTYTATRSLRMFDAKTYAIDDPAAADHNFKAFNGANECINLRMPNGTAQEDISRLGQNAADTCDDAYMLVAASGTIVFAYDDAGHNTISASIYCWPL